MKLAKVSTKVKKMSPPPNLLRLLYNLEAANSHPSSALEHLKDLAADVDKVVEKIAMVELMFGNDIDEN